MLIRMTASLFMLTASVTSWAMNPHDEYYADDLFTAIQEAKKRPHHYDYSSAKRYNRSTTQSLDIPRLLNQEMGSTSIESSDTNAISVTDIPLDEQLSDERNIYGEALVDNQPTQIQTVTPVIGNPNVSSPNITTNVISR